MRSAVLHLAFHGLGAERAESDAFEDNAASRAVSPSLGYVENGRSWALRQGQPAVLARHLLTRDVWMARRRGDIAIDGLGPCLELLGLTQAQGASG
jgi:RimJ/RimL family protein N-acetyltransferase